MSEIAIFLVGFIAGGVFSLLCVAAIFNKWAKEYDKEKKKLNTVLKKGSKTISDSNLADEAGAALKGLEDAMKDLELMGSIKERFKKVDEMIQEQLNLMSMIDGPSKGASHSRYKGEIARRIKELEESKLDIYKTILADGIDPILTAVVEGDTSKMKLSDAVRDMELALTEADGPPPKTNPKKPRKNFLKLVTEETPDESENSTIS